MTRLFFTVTNDLTFDQRMHRICTSLAENGYQVTLVGRRLPHSLPLKEKPFRQKRLTCVFTKGILFYAEYNIRLFFFLLFHKMDGICAIDLDTILPCLIISKWRNIPRVYDAHELFTEMKEICTRPFVKKFWMGIERFAVPKFTYGYTVSNGLAEEFKKRYGCNYPVIRNMTVLRTPDTGINPLPENKFILYQGAVNESRGLEYLIPAMQKIPYKLVICGDGNFMHRLKKDIAQYQVTDKVELKGMLLPDELRAVTKQAALGINLVENTGLNQYYSLPNKFFDYIHEAIPQITMNYPEYAAINAQIPVAILLDQLTTDALAGTVNAVMKNEPLLLQLKRNCLEAKKIYNWQAEEKRLLNFYAEVFRH